MKVNSHTGRQKPSFRYESWVSGQGQVKGGLLLSISVERLPIMDYDGYLLHYHMLSKSSYLTRAHA